MLYYFSILQKSSILYTYPSRFQIEIKHIWKPYHHLNYLYNPPTFFFFSLSLSLSLTLFPYTLLLPAAFSNLLITFHFRFMVRLVFSKWLMDVEQHSYSVDLIEIIFSYFECLMSWFKVVHTWDMKRVFVTFKIYQDSYLCIRLKTDF